MRAGLQVTEPQGAEGDALQGEHRVADRLAHAPHLTVAAFVDRQLQLVSPKCAQPPHARGRGGPVLQLHAGAQGAQGPLADGPAGEAHTVGAGHFVARIKCRNAGWRARRRW